MEKLKEHSTLQNNMRTHHSTIVCCIGILATAQLLFAQTESHEATYLLHAKDVANPGVELEKDEILRFQSDVTGDGKPEIFFSKASFRDGKQGNIWSIYSENGDGYIDLIGESTFSVFAFAPKIWNDSTNQFGFYTYGPGGAGKGLLKFYGIINGHLERLEQRKIEPNTTDKEEYDSIFGASRKDGKSILSIKRTLVSQILSESIDKSSKGVPDVFPSEVASADTSKVKAGPPTKESVEKASKRNQIFKKWLWFVSLVILVLLVWIFFKCQLRGAMRSKCNPNER